jgi:DNA-binding IclR family transcriptional regulator
MAQTPGDSPPQTAPPAGTTKPSKIGTVLTLLQRKDGATLAELVAATGWQPHTTRAALTGLKKKGHVIEKSQRAGATTYRISQGR